MYREFICDFDQGLYYVTVPHGVDLLTHSTDLVMCKSMQLFPRVLDVVLQKLRVAKT